MIIYNLNIIILKFNSWFLGLTMRMCFLSTAPTQLENRVFVKNLTATLGTPLFRTSFWQFNWLQNIPNYFTSLFNNLLIVLLPRKNSYFKATKFWPTDKYL